MVLTWADVPSCLGKDNLLSGAFLPWLYRPTVETGRRCSIPFSERHCPRCWVHGHELHRAAVEDAISGFGIPC